MKNILLSTIAFTFFIIITSCNAQNKKNKVEKHKYTNALINETSPYLLQHAHNPVNWHAWNDETLQKAKEENKLLLISVGYAACHWCHVMEHESFEDSIAAKVMNDNFICIKVDREERPDVDAIYMDACQLINNSGGWPLNAIALPDGRPIYAMTYAKKNEWIKVLEYFDDFYQNNKEQALEQAQQLTEGIIEKENIPLNKSEAIFIADDAKAVWANWQSMIDYKNGGRKGAPKFPMPYNYDYLMTDFYFNKEAKKLEAVRTTLDKMMMGGIYDQVGGGFARYATDAVWKVPHFEKMLYDNAQLVSTYSKAYALINEENYARVVRETLAYIEREMTDKSNGFYSSLDADSEGEEGLFYIWQEEELDKILGEDAILLKKYWNVKTTGNWEAKNILYATEDKEKYAKLNNITVKEIDEILIKARKKLLEARSKRLRPGLDDKILTSWNALMLKGYIDAYRYLGDENYLKTAIKNAEFIKSNCIDDDFRITRNYKNGVSSINGFLDDYSFTIEAFIALYEVTFDEQWLLLADNLTKYTFEHFYDKESSMFFYTSDLDKALITRKKEVQDNVIPSSNSSMAKALFLLSDYMVNDDYKDVSDKMLNNMLEYVRQYGTYYSNWALLLNMNLHKPNEIAIVGKDYEKHRKEMMARFIPNAIYLGGKNEGSLALLEGKLVDGDTYIYVCQNRICKLPVKEVDEAMKLLFD
ncbi:MAG: thioredoxin domain-containing protein [Chitinophagales bacterium]